MLLTDPLASNVPSDVVLVEGDVVGAAIRENVLVVGNVVIVLPLLTRLRISDPREETVSVRAVDPHGCG
jgi:hypothetical protein